MSTRWAEWLAFHRAVGVTHFHLFCPNPDHPPSHFAAHPDVTPAPAASVPANVPALLNAVRALATLPRGAWVVCLAPSSFLYPANDATIPQALARLSLQPVRQVTAETRGWEGRWLRPDESLLDGLTGLAAPEPADPVWLLAPQAPPLHADADGRVVMRLLPGWWTPVPVPDTCPLSPGGPLLRLSTYPYIELEAAREARRAGRRTPHARLDRALRLITPGRSDLSLSRLASTLGRGPRAVEPAGFAPGIVPHPPREFAVLGLRRSGNHAVIQWLLSGLGADRIFLNNVSLGRNPFEGYHGCDAGPYEEADFPLLAVPENRHWITGRLLYSFEDCRTQAAGAWLRERGPLLSSERATRVAVLILRDPYNLFASRIRVEENGSKICTPLDALHAPLLRDDWLEHAAEFAGRTRHLPELVTVDYVRFIGSPDYRASLAAQLGITPDEGVLARVPDFGTGSSFDGLQHDGAAHRMAVLDRWRHYADHPLFRALVADDRVLALAEELYGGLFDHRAIGRNSG